MDYKKHYDFLIDRARNRNRSQSEYYEKHHIIPRCIGGSDDKENLVNLTPEEHYVAHQLLIKIYPDESKLVYAANMMVCNRVNNKLYGWLRRKLSENMSKIQSGMNNSQYGTRWVHNKDSKTSKKILKNEPLESGWEEGRVINFDKPKLHKPPKNKCGRPMKNKCGRPKKIITEEEVRNKIKTKHFIFKKTEGYRRAKSKRLYEEFMRSDLSLRKFAISKDMIPMTLSKWFNEFIPEYHSRAKREKHNIT